MSLYKPLGIIRLLTPRNCSTAMCSLIYRSPFGMLEVHASERGINKVDCQTFESSLKPRAAVKDNHFTCTCKSKPCQATGPLLAASRWLEAFFAGNVAGVSCLPPFDLPGGDGFRARVLVELVRCTAPGDTITYGDLAERLGQRKAARAVGTAMRTNPIPLFIPCHRVTRSGGSLGNYSMGHGTLTKEWLLDHEKKMCAM